MDAYCVHCGGWMEQGEGFTQCNRCDAVVWEECSKNKMNKKKSEELSSIVEKDNIKCPKCNAETK